MTIKVLAESAKDKGRLLNQIVKRLLDELGYDDFRVRISGAGTDLEIKAKHRATQAAILCKARALPREVGPDELKRFLAAYTQGKKKDRRLVGLFLALSGLSRPAREWYASMEEKGKGEFHVFAPEKLLALLRRARLIGPPEVVEPAIKSRIRTDAGPRFLAFHEGQMYWVQMIMTGRKPTGFAVLASHGELVSRVVAREIKRLDPALDGKRLIDTHLRDKLFLTMLDMIPRNLEALTKEVREPLADVREVIQDLLRENVAVAEAGGQPRWKNDRYSLRADLALFLSLARQCLEGPNKFRFLSSQFAAAHLASDVPGYLEARWRFRTTDRERTRVLQMNRRMGDLLVRIAGDMEHPQFQELLILKGIKGHLFRACAKAATTQELAFALQADFLLAQAKAPGSGRGAPAGRSDFEHAIEDFSEAIKLDPTQAFVFHSRGIVYHNQRQLDRAIADYNEAIRLDPKLATAYVNRGRAFQDLGEVDRAMADFAQAKKLGR
jgi:tetratricopeptide (TPR) repeat protein